MLLQDLHEPSDVQLGVQRQVVHVGDERRDLLLELVEAVLEGAVGLVVVVGLALDVVLVVRAFVEGVWRVFGGLLLGLDVPVGGGGGS